jgi:hypothetical protein
LSTKTFSWSVFFFTFEAAFATFPRRPPPRRAGAPGIKVEARPLTIGDRATFFTSFHIFEKNDIPPP